jgi:uncharacterized protein
MSLKRKLDRLSGAGPGSHGPPSAGPDPAGDGRRARIAELRTVLESMAAREARRAGRPADGAAVAPVATELPGERRETPHGPLHVVDRYYEPDHCHGETPVRGMLSVGAEVVSLLALDVGLAEVDPRRMILLDTETTGLAGGMGTVPFLVGVAWFEDESLRVHQLLLRRPGEEVPMLHALAARLSEASCIVSYNGKSFDWPLVRNRFVLNRVPLPPPPPHLDLLHCARRVYKRRLGRLKLVDLEADLLGMHREGDIPGCDIPAIYFRYLREGDASGLSRVLEHNAHDLVALAALLARLADRFAALRVADDPRDHLGYAEVAARAGDATRAWEFAVAAAEGGGDGECTARAFLLCARLARRRGDVPAEQRALERALATAADDLLLGEAHLALAKLHEHRRGDFDRALVHARSAAPMEGEEASARRVERLRRKRSRAAGAGRDS